MVDPNTFHRLVEQGLERVGQLWHKGSFLTYKELASVVGPNAISVLPYLQIKGVLHEAKWEEKLARLLTAFEEILNMHKGVRR